MGCGGGGDDSGSDSSSDSDSSSGGPSFDAAAQSFLDTYVEDDGRVSRKDQGGDTVGEGQAYGMLVAAAAGDEDRFNSIWGWTKDNIRRPDGLISFLWKDGKVADPEAASDADVDATRALLVASCRFKNPALRNEAIELAKAIMSEETADFLGAPVLAAGPWARKAPVTVNPSYFAPATFAALGDVTGDGRWGSLSASGRTVTDLLMPNEGEPAARLGAAPGQQGGAERDAGQPERHADLRLRRAAHPGAVRGGSGPGRAAHRRQGLARLRGAEAVPDPGRARPVGQGDGHHPAPGGAGRGRGRGAGRGRHDARPPSCSTPPRRSTSRRRPTTAPPGSRWGGSSCSPTR